MGKLKVSTPLLPPIPPKVRLHTSLRASARTYRKRFEPASFVNSDLQVVALAAESLELRMSYRGKAAANLKPESE